MPIAPRDFRAVKLAALGAILHDRNASPPRLARYSVRPARSSALGGDPSSKARRGRYAMPHADAKASDVTGTARLLVVLLAFAWGLNWIAAAVALREVSPWSLRLAGSGIGTATLIGAALITGHNLKMPRGEYVHVMVAGFFNVAAFQIFSGFAQLSGATTRAIIITYSMPIWTVILSRLVLGEKLTPVRMLAFGLCVAGLCILVWPLFAAGFPPSVFYSLGCALSWAFATVYIKWVKVTVEPLANAAWQLLFGYMFIAIGTFMFEDYPHLWPVHGATVVAVLFVGVIGVGLAHFLWWSIVGRLPAITASLGSLLVPVIGVTASAVFLDERLTIPDIVGFVMIFAAAACVLLQRDVKHTEMPE
jgi:drug/metabolite transporter (DMT)-like permease